MTLSPSAIDELSEFIRQFEAGETPVDKFHHEITYGWRLRI